MSTRRVQSTVIVLQPVSGYPRLPLTGSGGGEIEPRTVRLEFSSRLNSHLELSAPRVTVSGPRVRKDGSEGAWRDVHLWWHGNDERPDWIAEVIRTARPTVAEVFGDE